MLRVHRRRADLQAAERSDREGLTPSSPNRLREDEITFGRLLRRDFAGHDQSPHSEVSSLRLEDHHADPSWTSGQSNTFVRVSEMRRAALVRDGPGSDEGEDFVPPAAQC